MFSWKWIWVTVFIYLVMELILLLCSCSDSAQSNRYVSYIPCPWSVAALLGYFFEFAECPYEEEVVEVEFVTIYISVILCTISQGLEDYLRLYYNLGWYRKIQEDLAPLKQVVARIILGLEKGSTAYHLESAFNGKASGNDDTHAKNYLEFVTLMGKELDERASDVFAEKLLNVITESKNQKSFKSQILSFWIKIYCLLDNAFISNEKRPELGASELDILLGGKNYSNRCYPDSARKKILLNIDALFEKHFNPGTCLSCCEQIYDNKRVLWLICQIYEWFFKNMYKILCCAD